MKNNKDTPHTAKELMGELQTLVAEAQGMMADSLAEHSAEAMASIRERLDAVQEKLSDVYDSTKKRVAAGAKQADETIRENPYQSMAVALGVGVLIGVLVGRRSR